MAKKYPYEDRIHAYAGSSTKVTIDRAEASAVTGSIEEDCLMENGFHLDQDMPGGNVLRTYIEYLDVRGVSEVIDIA